MPLLPELRREKVGFAPTLHGDPLDPEVAEVLEVVDDDAGDPFEKEDVTSDGLDVVTGLAAAEIPVVVVVTTPELNEVVSVELRRAIC